MTGIFLPKSSQSLFDSWVEYLSTGLLPEDGPYARDPVGYAEDVLQVRLWAKQEEVLRSVVEHPITMARASHSVGKTFVGGTLVNWHYDQFNPGITITTAPNARQVTDLLWKEVRMQRRDKRDLYPKAPRMQSSPAHYATGYTAESPTGFQGTHEERLLIIADEAVGIDAEIFEAIMGMLTSGEGNRLVLFYNPTDTGSAVYEMESREDVNVIEISVLDHPNIHAELAGKPRPFPKAVSLSWLESYLYDTRYTVPIVASDRKAGDLEWPPGSGQWYRPGPVTESRALARWPSQAINTVWSQAAFTLAITIPPGAQYRLPEPRNVPCEIGCDVARFGDDYTAIHVRRGPVSLHHESHNGWSTAQTAGRLKELAGIYGEHCGVHPRAIVVKVDDAGVGGGVIDQADGYRFIGVNGGSNAIDYEHYPNRRSELWFAVADRAEDGQLDLTRLPYNVQQDLRRQCLAPRWRLNAQGQRVVEPKEETKKRIGRSPDDADALNIAYAPPEGAPVSSW